MLSICKCTLFQSCYLLHNIDFPSIILTYKLNQHHLVINNIYFVKNWSINNCFLSVWSQSFELFLFCLSLFSVAFGSISASYLFQNPQSLYTEKKSFLPIFQLLPYYVIVLALFIVPCYEQSSSASPGSFTC